uniref:Uncharacterized protein n=1 Tax=Lygus hesperus TaxID=30085 RepID=A0A146KMY3_LYGHE
MYNTNTDAKSLNKQVNESETRKHNCATRKSGNVAIVDDVTNSTHRSYSNHKCNHDILDDNNDIITSTIYDTGFAMTRYFAHKHYDEHKEVSDQKDNDKYDIKTKMTDNVQSQLAMSAISEPISTPRPYVKAHMSSSNGSNASAYAYNTIVRQDGSHNPYSPCLLEKSYA